MSRDDSVRYSTLLLAIVLTIIATVLALEFAGLIQHSRDKEAVPVGEFRAIHVKPGETVRLSPKPSNLHARCQEGYLVIVSDTDPNWRGALVDYKDRAVRCAVPPTGDGS